MGHKKNFLRGRNKPIDISTASYVTESSALTISGAVRGITFKPDGTRVYTANASIRKVIEFSLSTAWDLSTLGTTQTDESPVLTTDNFQHFCFGDNGLKLYATHYNSGILKEYDLSPAWDISSAVFVQNGTISTPSVRCVSPTFTDDGLTLYVLYNSNDDVAQYSLSTAWDLSTLSHVATKASAVAGNTSDLKLFTNGDYLYVSDGGPSARIIQSPFSTPFDVTTLDSINIFEFNDGYTPYGCHIFESTRKMYIWDNTNKKIVEYNL